MTSSRETFNIVHLSFSGDFGGREKVASVLCKVMKSLGRICFLYMVVEKRAGSSRNANLINALRSDGDGCKLFYTSSKLSWPLMRQIASSLQEDRAAVVHCHCYKSLFYAAFMKRLKMIDSVIVYTLHGLVLRDDFKSKIIEKSESLGIGMADGVVGCSREVLERTLPPKWKRPTRVLINSLDSGFADYKDLITYRKNARSLLVNHYGLPANIPIVINVGRLTPQKNFNLYLQMIKQLAEMGDVIPETIFLVVGDGELRSELEQMADQLQLKDKVRFSGFVEDMATLYAGADLLVQSSSWEGTPMCLLEARTFGLPVVAPAVGGNGEVVNHGRDGALYSVGDLASLTNETARYLGSASLREEHGRLAFKHVTQEFGTSDWAIGHINFYDELLSLKKKRAEG
jgi:glycosyltransferase involved in cell wall biosynthesis